MSASTVAISIEGEEALDDIQPLVRECYGKDAEPVDWWRWWLFGRGPGSSRVVVAREGSRPVGMQPISFFPYRQGNGILRGGVLAGGMVSPNARRRGVFRELVTSSVEEAWREGAAFVTTMPNARSYPAFRAFGWSDPGLRTLMVARRARQSPARSLVKVPEPEEAENPPFAPERDSAWSRWRFHGNPLSEYVTVGTGESAASDLGFAVGTIRNLRGIAIGFLVDVVGRRGGATAHAASLLVAELRTRGAAVVLAVVAGRHLRQDLRDAGFHAIPPILSPRRFRMVFLPRPGIPASECPPASIDDWMLTLADWDGI